MPGPSNERAIFASRTSRAHGAGTSTADTTMTPGQGPDTSTRAAPPNVFFTPAGHCDIAGRGRHGRVSHPPTVRHADGPAPLRRRRPYGRRGPLPDLRPR